LDILARKESLDHRAACRAGKHGDEQTKLERTGQGAPKNEWKSVMAHFTPPTIGDWPIIIHIMA
jgi:hypothetical protein